MPLSGTMLRVCAAVAVVIFLAACSSFSRVTPVPVSVTTLPSALASGLESAPPAPDEYQVFHFNEIESAVDFVFEMTHARKTGLIPPKRKKYGEYIEIQTRVYSPGNARDLLQRVQVAV